MHIPTRSFLLLCRSIISADFIQFLGQRLRYRLRTPDGASKLHVFQHESCCNPVRNTATVYLKYVLHHQPRGKKKTNNPHRWLKWNLSKITRCPLLISSEWLGRFSSSAWCNERLEFFPLTVLTSVLNSPFSFFIFSDMSDYDPFKHEGVFFFCETHYYTLSVLPIISSPAVHLCHGKWLVWIIFNALSVFHSFLVCLQPHLATESWLFFYSSMTWSVEFVSYTFCGNLPLITTFCYDTL